MGLKNSRPQPHAHAELHVAPFLQRRIRSWHLDHVTQLALLRYRSLTKRCCVDALQLAAMLGIKDETFMRKLMQLFLPRTPTRVQCMVDAMEVFIAFTLVCQAPSMRSRFEAIFDVIDVNSTGCITPTDLVVLLSAVGRAIMKVFSYSVEPDPHAAMIFINNIVHSGLVVNGKIAKSDICTHMLLDHHAVHYAKLCTGEDKPKLYVMLEKDTEFVGAIQFSDMHDMRSASLRTVREMVRAQVFHAPPDFHFLCQGREVKRVWELDRLAWSIVPFALRGSPGLRMHALTANRALEQPASGNRFEFRYMGNTLPRYKKRVQEIAPVYRHCGFRLGSGGRLCAVQYWRVANNWSGEWVYGQATIEASSKREVQKRLRTALRPHDDMVVVKSHRGELIELLTDDQSTHATSDHELAVPHEMWRATRAPSISLHERKRESARRQQRIQWKARVIAMEAQQHKDELELKRVGFAFKENATRQPRAVSSAASTSDSLKALGESSSVTTSTVLVHIEENDVLPSRLVPTVPKKRPRPRKKRYSKYEWYVPSRARPLPVVNTNMLVVKLLSEQIVLQPASCYSDGRARIDTGRFLPSSNICLESDEVEVFPVLVLRPIEPQLAVDSLDREISDSAASDQSVDVSSTAARERKLLASASYLSEFEYELSSSESNYEALLHHINSAAMQDTLCLNRRDVLGRTMLHDAAEFGHGNVLELLLRARVLLNVSDARGDTALHHAARRGRLREVSLLLRENAVAWSRNHEGKSPLLCALETAERVLTARTRQRASATLAGDTALGGENCDAFIATHMQYPKLRQVIDLLWDRYSARELAAVDIFDRQSCLYLEKAIYGDLFHACRTGNLLRVQRLMDLEKRPIQQYINDQLDTLGRTALHEATELGHTAIVDLLLKVGADGYIRDQRAQLPLHIAATKGCERIARCLVAAFPGTLGVQDVSGKSALHLAVERRHWRVASDLIAAMRDRLAATAADDHALSAESNSADELARIVNLQDVHGYTALHYACIHSHEALSLELLAAGANPLVSRVMHSVASARRDLLGVLWKSPTLLRRWGVDPSVSSVRSWTLRSSTACTDNLVVAFDVEAPLESLLKSCKQHPASVSACKRIIEALLVASRATGERSALAKRCAPQCVKKSPSPLLHLAAAIAAVNMSVAVELCRHLVKLQIEINMLHTGTGETVLLQECKRVCSMRNEHRGSGSGAVDAAMQLALVRTLIELGANVTLANERNGESPLGCAAWFGHLELLDVLLEARPDCDFFVRSCSFSPLHFASLGGHVACAKMLLAAHASVSTTFSQPTSDETPLFFAVRSKSESMVALLLHSGANVGTLCTVRRGTTSFGISLDIVTQQRSPHAARMEKMATSGPTQKLIDIALAPTAVVSSLTLALEIARSLSPFSDMAGGVDPMCAAHITKRAEWERLGRICLMLATKLGEATTTSGLITRSDVQLASALGYWDVVRVLLAHQVVLPSVSMTSTMNALHYAAAAGQTTIVSALSAAGMDVNCVVARLRPRRHIVRDWKASSTTPETSKTATTTTKRLRCDNEGGGENERMLHWNVGALFFALVRGHIETAAKLLVLGASALDTLPYVECVKRVKRHDTESHGASAYIDGHTAAPSRTIAFLMTESMRKELRTLHITMRFRRRHMHCDPSIHFVRLLERSINDGVPLLQLSVAVGYSSVVQLLVSAGNSAFQIFPSAAPDGVGETAIHVAVAHGRMALLRYFSSLAQYNFPSCFVRENKRPKSLLVTACEHQQLEALRYLLQTDRGAAAGTASGDVSGGGGFKYVEQRDEFQRALSACAARQFVAGFHLLLASGAQPNLTVLVATLQGIGEPMVPETLAAAGASDQLRTSKALGHSKRPPLARTTRVLRRNAHPTKPRNTVARARELLAASIPFASDLDVLFSTAVTFDSVLKTLIVCARCEFWFVLERIFVVHAARFVGAASVWKPIVVRAISCCLVLHRAALHNRVELVRFILSLGVPADLRLSEMPFARSPIWYAASRGCLESFVLLALATEPQSLGAVVASLDYNSRSRCFSLYFRTICDSRSVLVPGSTRKWRNMSAFSCYDVPRAQTNALVIQKLIAFARREQIEGPHANNSLLHLACRRGELLTVEALLRGGANVRAENARKETPLLVAAERQDARGTAIVCHLLAVMSAATAASDATTISCALVRCFAQPAPCNLKIAKVLLAAGADAAFAISQDETGAAPCSAMQLALQSMQLACVKLLLDRGAELSVALVEVFLKRLLMTPSFERNTHWRRFAEFLVLKEYRLVEVEGIMALLLERKHFARAMTEDLLHQLIKCASAVATTVARALGMEKRFWHLVALALETYPDEARARMAEWGDRTALHYAVLGLEGDIVAQLLDVGAYSVLAEDQAKQTPLHIVAMNGDVSICALLLRALEREAKVLGVDAVNARGRTALHIAVIHGHETVTEMLVNAGASTELRCADGLNALLYACKCNRLGILMTLFKRTSANTHALLLTPAGEHAIFVAARHGAFQIVRWLAGALEFGSLDGKRADVFALCCLQQRTLLHYASMCGDTEFVRQQLEIATAAEYPASGESVVDQRDATGYTPLLYAFGFGRIEAFELLLNAGASADLFVDHSGEACTHPYATAFNIASLLEWFAFPGWYSFASTRLAPREKRRVTVHESICEDYFMNSSIRRWRARQPSHSRPTTATSSAAVSATPKRSLLRICNSNTATPFEPIRTSMRHWRFPQLSLFDFVCDVGDAAMAAFLIGMRLPLLLRRSTYQSQRRNMLQAVRWNRVDVVKSLLAASALRARDAVLTEATRHTDGLHFDDFVEAAIDCAVSRGHEEVAICLLEHWNDVKGSGRTDAGMFAFQFAHVLQIACIRCMPKLIDHMITRGGEQLVSFHENDGPALVYAVGFGHVDVAAQLLAAGTHFSSLHTFTAPSAKKWAEFGCLEEIQLPPSHASQRLANAMAVLPDFVGPLETYDASSCSERLSVEQVVAAFAPAQPDRKS